MIDLLWTTLGGLAGAELGVVSAWAADRGRKPRPWMRRYFAGLGLVLGGAIGAAFTLPPVVTPQLDAAGPTFKAIHQHYPAVFAQMTAATKNVDPRDAAALKEKLRPIFVSFVEAHRDEMDDASAEAVGRLLLEETEPLREANPAACVAALSGRPDLRAAQDPEQRRREGEVIGSLIDQMATHPAAPPARASDEEAKRLTEHALNKLTSGDRETVTVLMLENREASTPRETAAWCAFQRARIGAALDAPTGTLRRLLAG